MDKKWMELTTERNHWAGKEMPQVGALSFFYECWKRPDNIEKIIIKLEFMRKAIILFLSTILCISSFFHKFSFESISLEQAIAKSKGKQGGWFFLQFESSDMWRV